MAHTNFNEQIPNPALTETKDYGEADGYIDYTLYLDERQPIPNLKTICGKVRAFNAMKTNSTISGILLAFKSLSLTPSVLVEENPDDPDRERARERANFLQSCINDMQTPFSDVIGEILDMIDMGFKVVVPQFKARTGFDTDVSFNSRYNDGKIGWKNFTPIDPETITKWHTPSGGGYLGLTGISQRSHSGQELPIPRNRMLLFRTIASNNDPTGKSILEGAYLDWLDLIDANKIQMVGLRRSLEGIPYARIHSKLQAEAKTKPASAAAVRAVKKAVIDLDARRDTAFILPADRDENGNLLAEVRMLGTADGGGNSKIQDAKLIIDQKEQTIARSMLAQFMTIQGKGGSYALSKNQSEVFINSLKGYITQISGVFNNEAIPRLFAANKVTPEKDGHFLPTIRFTDFIKDDVSEFFTGLKQAIETGVFGVTEQIQKKAGHVLGVDISGQAEILEERNARKLELEEALKNPAPVTVGDQGTGEAQETDGSDIPNTSKEDITDPTLKNIIEE